MKCRNYKPKHAIQFLREWSEQKQGKVKDSERERELEQLRFPQKFIFSRIFFVVNVWFFFCKSLRFFVHSFIRSSVHSFSCSCGYCYHLWFHFSKDIGCFVIMLFLFLFGAVLSMRVSVFSYCHNLNAINLYIYVIKNSPYQIGKTTKKWH